MRIGSVVLVVLALSCSGTPPSVTCPNGAQVCAGACADTKVDDMNCGACGTACAATEGCAGGKCYPKDCTGADCAANQVCPSGACIDRSCVGVVCGAGQLCFQGACTTQSCAGKTCSSLEVCLAGVCV